MRTSFCCFILLAFISTSVYCDNDEDDQYCKSQFGMYNDAEHGNMDGVLYCIVKTDVINFAYNNCENNTALHVAALEGQEDIVNALIRNGWNPNASNEKFMTPLHYAVKNGHERIVDLLILNGSDVNAVNKDGHTPMILAITKGDKKIVDILVSYGANVASVDINISPESFSNLLTEVVMEQYTAYSKLMENGKPAMRRIEYELFRPIFGGPKVRYAYWLIRIFKPNTGIKNEDGDTPLHQAAKMGHLEFARALIGTGVNLNTVNKYGATPLHYAAQNGYEKVVELLLRKGANFNIKKIRTKGTPLHYATIGGHWQSVYLLLLHGADPNARSIIGFTPLHYAVVIIERLYQTEDPTEDYLSFLFTNYKKIIEILLQSNANRHNKSLKGQLLMDAVKSEDIIAMFRQIHSVAEKECTRYSEIISRNRADSRAANGMPAASAEFPWMAAVGRHVNIGKFSSIPVFNCGGTIISEFFVMTAAHCIHPKVYSEDMVVRVGTEFILFGAPPSGQDYGVEKIIRPNYQVELQRGDFIHSENDIALLRLKEPIQFSSVVSPACLHVSRNEEDHHVEMTISGWGLSENQTRSEYLQKATVKTMPHSECAKTHNLISDSQNCAYTSKYKSPFCKGDGGGPLQYFSSGSNLATVVGVISYSHSGSTSSKPSCPSSGPGVFTKVDHYLDWIQSHVWPNETAMKYFDDKNINEFNSGVYMVDDKSKKKIILESSYNSKF